MKRLILLLPAIVLLTAGCDIIRVAEYTHHFDADGDDIVIVVMDDTTPGWELRCEDMGGKPEIDADGVATCFNVDK